MKTEEYNNDLNKLFSKLFDENNEDISVADLYLLSDMPDEQLDTFKERWITMSDERRHIISRHLADISEENFQVDFSPLTLLFFADPLASVRTAALDSLWDTSNISLIKPIIRLVQEDPDPAVRAAATSTLGHYILMSQWDELPRHIEKPIVDVLVPNLLNNQLDPAIWRATLEALAGSSYEEIHNYIERAYESSDPQMQQSAIFSMGLTADRRWVPTLLDELENYDADVRAEAVRALGTISSTEASQPLAELVYDDEDLEVRLAAVFALGQIGGEVASKALERLADDPEAADLYDAIDEALEEISWLGDDIDLSLFDFDDEDWDD